MAHYVLLKPQPEESKANIENGIIRKEEQEWPREFVKNSLEARDPDAVPKSKIIKFADEEVM